MDSAFYWKCTVRHPLKPDHIDHVFYCMSIRDISAQLNQHYATQEYTVSRIQSVVRRRAKSDSKFIDIVKLRPTKGPKSRHGESHRIITASAANL